MATAEQLRAEFEKVLTQQNIAYQVADEDDNLLRFLADAEPLGEDYALEVFFDFEENKNNAFNTKVIAPGFALCKAEHFLEVLMKLNDYNMEYRWAKFFMEFAEDAQSATLSMSIDNIVFPGTAGVECFQATRALISIMGEVLSDLAGLVSIRVVPVGGAAPCAEEPSADEPSEAELRAMLEAIKRKLGE